MLRSAGPGSLISAFPQALHSDASVVARLIRSDDVSELGLQVVVDGESLDIPEPVRIFVGEAVEQRVIRAIHYDARWARISTKSRRLLSMARSTDTAIARSDSPIAAHTRLTCASRSGIV